MFRRMMKCVMLLKMRPLTKSLNFASHLQGDRSLDGFKFFLHLKSLVRPDFLPASKTLVYKRFFCSPSSEALGQGWSLQAQQICFQIDKPVAMVDPIPMAYHMPLVPSLSCIEPLPLTPVHRAVFSCFPYIIHYCFRLNPVY